MILHGCNINIKVNKLYLMVFLLLLNTAALAVHTDYTYNTLGGLSPAYGGAPPLPLVDASLEIQTGTFQLGGASTISLVPDYTVQPPPDTLLKNVTGTITINPATSISHTAAGSTITGSAVNYPGVINNAGTINKGAGTNAINLTASGSTMTINNTGTIIGPVLLGNNMYLYIDGAGSINGAISGSGPADVLNSLYFGQTTAVNYTITGGNISNVGTIVIANGTVNVPIATTITGLSQTVLIQANGTLKLNSTLTGIAGPAANMFNSGAMTWGLGTAVSTLSGIQNNGTFDISNTSTNDSPIDNAGAMTVTAQLTGAGIIRNNANGVLVVSTGGATIDHPILNQVSGTFTVLGSTVITAEITNQGSMVISNTLGGGTGAIANNNGASLTLNGTANISNAAKIINNSQGANLYVNAASTVNANIINDGTMTISANITRPGASTITGSGTVIVNGNRSLITGAGTYTNSGTHYTTITNVATSDSLTSAGPITITTVQVASTFLGAGTWDVLTASGGPPTITNILLPQSGLLGTWSSSFVGNSLRITQTFRNFESQASGTNNLVIARILDGMLLRPANAGQSALVQTFAHSGTASDFNTALSKLVPNVNSVATNVATQNAIFGKIETRIAAVLDDQRPTLGFTAGDLGPNSAIWFGGFGSIAKQGAVFNNRGYKARTTGVLMGFDHKYCERNIQGFALGVSNTSTDELLNLDSNTKTVGVHALLYGAYRFNRNDFFEWLAAAAVNRNNSSRRLIVGGTNLSTSAKNNWYQAAGRMNVGKNFDFADYFRISPLLSLQYSYINEPHYDEMGSVAALHVENTTHRNIVTLGAGSKLSFPADDWWLVGSRELRAMVTYDVARTEQVTTANFLVGGPSFIFGNSPAKLAVKLGVDFSFEIFRNTQLQISYDYELRHKYTDHTGIVKIRYIY